MGGKRMAEGMGANPADLRFCAGGGDKNLKSVVTAGREYGGQPYNLQSARLETLFQR